jgi:hypothetical protein
MASVLARQTTICIVPPPIGGVPERSKGWRLQRPCSRVRIPLDADARRPAEASTTAAQSAGRELRIDGGVPSPVEVAAPARAVRLWPELPLQLHQAPDLDTVRAAVRFDADSELADGGQVDAEQLRALVERRRDRPTQLRVVPSPHRDSVSNTSSSSNREWYVPTVHHGRDVPFTPSGDNVVRSIDLGRSDRRAAKPIGLDEGRESGWPSQGLYC